MAKCVRLIDGSTLGVESDEGVVNLVRRDAEGNVVDGIALAPPEAHRVGQMLIEGSFRESRRR